jgi:hypothetical protein
VAKSTPRTNSGVKGHQVWGIADHPTEPDSQPSSVLLVTLRRHQPIGMFSDIPIFYQQIKKVIKIVRKSSSRVRRNLQQSENEDDERDHEQYVDQAASDFEAESERPEH